MPINSEYKLAPKNKVTVQIIPNDAKIAIAIEKIRLALADRPTEIFFATKIESATGKPAAEIEFRSI